MPIPNGMFIQSVTLAVKHCTSCGRDHTALEFDYINPPVILGNETYTFVGVCPNTGKKIYATVLTEGHYGDVSDSTTV